MNDLTTLQFILLAIAFASGVMIGLQLAVRRWVWTPYVLVFIGSTVGYAGTVLL